MNLPEGFKSLKDNEPPQWEDILIITEDGKRIVGYYAGKRYGKDEYCTATDDENIEHAVGWMPMI
ncbi:MAG: hypothetical protein IJP16_05065 [Clostridia bacterium]|nr:hypothetical protein [Clostridia bacterium]